jgi:hypothetical protein
MEVRENITIESDDVEMLLCGSNTGDFKWVEQENGDTDPEKGFSYADLVVQRKSDQKYFAAYGILDSPYESPEDTEFEEVFMETITVTKTQYK